MNLPEPPALIESRYRLESVLGEGGFGVVYQATDVVAGRSVAVKLLRPEGATYSETRLARSQLRGLESVDWLVHLPPDYDEEVEYPLMVLLHEAAESGGGFLEYSGFVELADRESLVLLAPTDSFVTPWREVGTSPRVWDVQHCDDEPVDFPYPETVWRFFTEVAPPKKM